MAFDFGAGLANMGADVAKVAGAASLEAQKSDADKEKLKMVNDLTAARESQGRQETFGYSSALQKDRQTFEGDQKDKELTSAEKRTGMTNQASKDVANITGGFSERGHQIAGEASKEVERMRAEADKYRTDRAYGKAMDLQEMKGKQAKELKSLGTMTDDSINTHAEMMLINGGVLPSGMGMNAVSYADKVRMDNRMNEMMQERHISIEDLQDRKAMNKFTGPALAALQKQRQATESYIVNADNLTERMISQAKAIQASDLGSKLGNKTLQELKLQFTDNPQLQEFIGTVQAVQSERAKILSGAMGNAAATDAAQAKVDKMLNQAMPFNSLVGAANNLKIESDSRLKSFQYEEKRLIARMNGRDEEAVARPAIETNENPKANPPVPMKKDGTANVEEMMKRPGLPFSDGRGGDWMWKNGQVVKIQ